MSDYARVQREQAAEVLEKFQKGIYGHGGKVGVAIDTAIAALLSSQPGPITGLVPCGCGAIAKVRKSQAPYSGYYIVCQNINCICNVGFDRDTSGVPLGYFKTEEEAIKAWNTAMGWRAEE